jgi:chromosome transmission fidelity protein 8
MATKVALYPSPKVVEKPTENPLPQLLQTPSGLALLEMQGTINTPSPPNQDEDDATSQPGSYETPIGRLVFPDYEPGSSGGGEWQKRVYLYVGMHQRLTGEVKKLPKAIAIIRKRAPSGTEGSSKVGAGAEELEIVEIVKFKIIFSNRPEPVGTAIADIVVDA